MSPGCVLAEFLRPGRPRRVPLRACCVAALLAGGRGCPLAPIERAPVERVPVAEGAGAS